MRATFSRHEARRYTRSSSFKMALLFAVLLGASAGVLGYFSYYFNRGHYIESADAVIDTDMDWLLAAEKRGALVETLDEVPASPGHVTLLADQGRAKIAGNLNGLPASAGVLTEGTVVFELRGATFAAKVHLFPDGRILLTGMDITRAVQAYRIMQGLSLASILLMAIVVSVSFLISTFVVSRTNRIAATARTIMQTGDLSRRIGIDARWDDLSAMATVLNALFGQVEDLVQGIRRVSDNIAHDLRTPLTRLLNNLEEMREAASDDTTRDRCEILIEEATRLIGTFNALLRITGIETGRQKQNFSQLDLQQIVRDVVALYEPLAEEKHITLALDAASVLCTGDRDMLFQALANIVDNAIKFTPQGGRVEIALLQNEGRAILTIRDTGPGIAAVDKTKVFDRFYRADASRSTGGNGLGLALVAAVVGLHGGSIALHDSDPGLLVKITL